MREIKFRAWDGDIMHNNVIPIISDDGKNYNIIEVHPLAGMRISPYTVELMQYTGLKDKNGKEIYEGDVLTPRWKQNPTYQFRYIVYYKDGAFSAKHYDIDNDWTNHLERQSIKQMQIEVIGNIYENPELLEAKND